jgi:hypothetical protein
LGFCEDQRASFLIGAAKLAMELRRIVERLHPAYRQ